MWSTAPREVGLESDIVFVCVSDTPDVEEVVFGDHGVIHGMTHGDILVDHSTISPVATKDLAIRAAELGVDWVDAPVSGGSEGAVNGTLAVMVGGSSDAVEKTRPFMDSYSKSIVHVGVEPGSGQMVKAVNQVLVVLNQLAVSEALLLAQAAELDLHKTLEAVEGGAAGSWMLSNRGTTDDRTRLATRFHHRSPAERPPACSRGSGRTRSSPCQAWLLSSSFIGHSRRGGWVRTAIMLSSRLSKGWPVSN